jgi:hypothetical protein
MEEPKDIDTRRDEKQEDFIHDPEKREDSRREDSRREVHGSRVDNVEGNRDERRDDEYEERRFRETNWGSPMDRDRRLYLEREKYERERELRHRSEKKSHFLNSFLFNLLINF